MSTKRYLVTGANSGLGRACALQLAQMGHETILVCRNQEPGEAALHEISRQSDNSNVTVRAKIRFTYGLVRRLEGTGEATHTVSPRFTRTNLSSHYPFFVRYIAAWRMRRAKAVRPEVGSTDVLFPLLSSELDGQTGKVFVQGC